MPPITGASLKFSLTGGSNPNPNTYTYWLLTRLIVKSQLSNRIFENRLVYQLRNIQTNAGALKREHCKGHFSDFFCKRNKTDVIDTIPFILVFIALFYNCLFQVLDLIFTLFLQH